MSDGQLVIDTLLDTDGVEKGLNKLNGLVKTGMKAAVSAIAGVGTALVGAAGYAVKVGSDFEAGMSEVSAISGATGSDLDALTAKAKEMGADTKFSATESAEAFKYMAMAGWNSGQMCDGIAGIMDLAAASGEDLASTSDIVTDALTAFGLQASDSGHFADVLAKASSSANTNVSLMGETFKYVAPVAGALGYNVEDMSVAIGLMANSGIKGSEAGTALRSVLSRMAKPTDDVQKAMSALGLSLTNSDGSMKSFNEVMVDMRKGFSGLTQEQKASYAAMLGGQEAMSGLLAIANASETDFDNLTDAIANCDGAAHSTATTMNDNLNGALDNLKGAAETLGIEVYESLQVPLKNLAKQGASYVDELTKAFENSGLEGLVGSIGSVFSEVTLQAAQAMPDMIDAAVGMIEAFNGGLEDNMDAVANAGIDIAKSLIVGVGDIAESFASLAANAAQSLIDNLYGPKISKSFSDFISQAKSSLSSMEKSAISIFNQVKKALGNLIGVASDLGKTIFPILAKAVKLCADNFKILVPLVIGYMTAVKGYAVISSAVKAITSFSGTLKAAISIIKEASKAQEAFNAIFLANPYVVAAAAILGVAAAIGAYAIATNNAADQTDSAIAKMQEFNEKMNEQVDAYKTAKEEREKAVQGTESEYGHYQQLVNELDNITDANGNVISGYEDRASTITGVLSNALGQEITTDGLVRDGKQEVIDKIEELITKKKAEAQLANYEQDYADALKNQTQTYNDVVTAKQNLADITEQLNSAKEQEQYWQEKLNDDYGDDPFTTQMYKKNLSDAKDAVSDLTKQQSENSDTLEGLQDRYLGYQTTISNYEGVSSAVISGDTASINDSLNLLVNGFVSAENGTKESLERQVENATASYNNMKKAFAEGEPGVTAQMVENAGKMVEASVLELNKIEPQSDLIMKTAGQMAADAIGSKAGDVADASDTVGEAAINSLRSIFGSARQAGEQTTDEYASGAESQAGVAESATEEVSSQANSGLTTSDTGNSGVNFIAGFINGIRNKANDGSLFNTIAGIGAKAIACLNHSLDEHSPSRKTKKSGKFFTQGFTNGIVDDVGSVGDAVSEISDEALSGLDDFDFSSTINTSSLTLQMEQAVADVTAHLGAKVATSVNYFTTNTEEKQQDNVPQKPIVIEVPLNINGREFAKATTPYISEQLTDSIRRKM